MSTATNHRKRSHRSEYLTRCYNGSRRSVVKPSVTRHSLMDWIRQIRRARNRSKQEAQDAAC
jgi:hypothetical protein